MKSLQHIFNGLQLKWKCGRRNKGDLIWNQITKGAYCAATLNWVLLGKVLSTVACASAAVSILVHPLQLFLSHLIPSTTSPLTEHRTDEQTSTEPGFALLTNRKGE